MAAQTIQPRLNDEVDGYRFLGGDPNQESNWQLLPPTKGAVIDGFRFNGGDPNQEANWSKIEPRGFLSAAAESGVRTLAAAGARLVDELNPFTLSEQDAAVLYKDDPKGFKRYTEESAAAALQRFAQEQTRRAGEVMQQADPTEVGTLSQRPLSELEYFTTDTDKAAYLSPTRVAGDVLQSLPTTLALAVTTYLTKGRANKASQAAFDSALARGAGQAEAQELARKAAMAEGARTMATVGGLSEGAITAAQQFNDTLDQIDQIPQAQFDTAPEYQALIQEGFSPEVARAKLSQDIAYQSAIPAGIQTGLISAAGGAYLGKLIGEGGSLLSRTGRGALTEGLTEAPQSAGEQISQNVAMATLDPTIDPFAGAGEAAAAGFVLGNVTGGAFSGALGSRQRLQASENLKNAKTTGDAAAAADQLSGSLVDLTAAIDAYLAQPQPLQASPTRAEVPVVEAQPEAQPQATPTPEAPPANPLPPSRAYADLTPMEPLAARQRLAVMRDEAARSGRDTNALVIAQHPDGGGRLAIQRLDATEKDFSYTPELQGQQREPEPVLTDPVNAFVNEQRRINTPAAQRFVQDFDAGLIRAEEVESLLTQPQGPQEQIEAAASQATTPEPSTIEVPPVSRPRERPVEGEDYIDRPLTEQAIEDDTQARLAALDAPDVEVNDSGELVVIERNLKPEPDALPRMREVDATERLAQARPLEEAPSGSIILTNLKLSPDRGDGMITVNDQGTVRKIKQVDLSELGDNGKLIGQIARIFGKRVVAFEDDTIKADGFVNTPTPENIYINKNSQVSPLAVFGHELLHLIKVDNVDAYKSIARVVAKNFTTENRAAFRQNYGKGASLEEFSADLVGNRFQEEQFWQDVFEDIGVSKPEEQRSIIARLSAALQKAINAFVQVIETGSFVADAFVNDLDSVQQAVRASIGQYAESRRDTAIEFDTNRTDDIDLSQTITPTFSTERTRASDTRKAETYNEQFGIKPYVSEGQLEIPVETKFSVKRQYNERQQEKGKKNHPILDLPTNKDGTVTLYYPTTNDKAREVIRTRKLKGGTSTSNRIYLTNESEPQKVAADPGSIDQPVIEANVLVHVDPNLLEFDQDFETGRRDFFIPIAEGKAFERKLKQVKLFTLNRPREEGISPDTTLKQITERVTKAISEFEAMSPREKRARLTEAKNVLKDEHNLTILLRENGKLEKTRVGDYGLTYDGKSVASLGLGLASAQKINNAQKLTTCPQSAICEALCLGETAGQNELYGGEGQFRQGPRLSQYLKTEALVLHPEEFAVRLYKEIETFRDKKAKEDFVAAIRLNVTSDLNPDTFESIIKAFPDVQFYDYTKLATRSIAENHHLTYSSTGASQVVRGKTILNPWSNWDRMTQRLNRGQNVAMAFTSKTAMPKEILDEKTGQRFEVWNGDNYDARFLDPKRPDGMGMVIGLTNKDRTTKPEDAAEKHNGFFMDYDPQRDGDTLVIKDQEKLKNGGRKVIPLNKASRQRQNIYGQPLLSNWTMPTDDDPSTWWETKLFNYQDKLIDTKRVIKNIEDTTGANLDDGKNPYLKETLYYGRTARATKDFMNNELKPLLQTISGYGITIPEFEEYLHNRHAETRNKQIAKINPAMPDGGSGIDTAEARRYLAALDPSRKQRLEALAKQTDSIIKGTQDLLVASGLETQDTVDQWRKTYPDYVPLMREDLDWSSNSSVGSGQGFDVRGPSSKRAMGSKANVVDILANLAMQRERTIDRAEKTRIGRALFALALNQPNSKFWLAVDPESIPNIQVMAQKLQAMGFDPQDAMNIAKEPKARYIDSKTGLVTERINSALRRRGNVFAIRVDGKDRFVFFNENDPRAKRMVQGLKNLDAPKLEDILSWSAVVTRYFSAINTQYNPFFGAYNFLRDVQGGVINLTSTPIANRKTQVLTDSLRALRGIYTSLRAERDGLPTPNDSWSKLFVEFQEMGAQTGYKDVFIDSEERARGLEKELNQMTASTFKRPGRYLMGWLSDFNDTMENAVRLAAYKAAKDANLTTERSAYIAKNLTVNFNKKGMKSAQAGALYAFFNASVQGTARLYETLEGPAGRKILGGGFLLGVMQAYLLHAAGFDEDEPPAYIRERNIVIPTGENTYVAWPMPLGFNYIPNVGRLLGELAISGGKNAGEKFVDLIGGFLEAFSPIGNSGLSLQTLAPTPLDPLVALAENRDWTGKPIFKENRSSLDPEPGFTRTKETASAFSKGLTKYLNLASGGTMYRPGMIDVTPDQIDYLIGTAFGGVGREALKISQAIQSAQTGEELPPYKQPFVGRFYGRTDSQAANSGRFYKNLTLLNEHENEIKGLQKEGKSASAYIQANPEARFFQYANRVERDLRELKRRRRELVERGQSKESVKQVETRINELMLQFNERVGALQK